MAHELRNEVVEELNPDLMSESRAEPDVKPVRDGRNRGMVRKEGRRPHSEQHACPRRGNPTAVKAVLSRRQTERGGKAFCDAEQSDRHLARCWDSRVASEPLLKVETIMRALGTGQGRGWEHW